MIKKRIETLKKNFKKYRIDGYIIPKNDEFFSEQLYFDRLKKISNFSGSAGLAIILKKKNYLFVDGRYTIQAKKESGKYFNIVPIHKYLPHKILKNLALGFDPNLFTKNQINYYFGKNIELKPINKNLVANKITEKINQGLDLLGRDEKFNVVKIDNNFPKYLIDNKKKYSDWISK